MAHRGPRFAVDTPCPFCGTLPREFYKGILTGRERIMLKRYCFQDEDGEYSFFCPNCWASGPKAPTMAKAAHRWTNQNRL